MAGAIRIYIEGGGDSARSRHNLRQAFGDFLSSLRERARQARARWDVVACGSRTSTFDDFSNALRGHPDASCLLLVDSEGDCKQDAWLHLRSRDHWIKPDRANDDACHLMIQVMEAWFLADRDQLQAFYGQGFRVKALPKLPKVSNPEKVAKERVFAALETATKNTQKGPYHKTKHAPDILARLRLDVVRQHAPSCDHFASTIERLIAESA